VCHQDPLAEDRDTIIANSGELSKANTQGRRKRKNDGDGDQRHYLLQLTEMRKEPRPHGAGFLNLGNRSRKKIEQGKRENRDVGGRCKNTGDLWNPLGGGGGGESAHIIWTSGTLYKDQYTVL